MFRKPDQPDIPGNIVTIFNEHNIRYILKKYLSTYFLFIFLVGTYLFNFESSGYQ